MLSVRERSQVSIIILLLSAYAILTKRKRSIVRAPTINRDDERRMALRRMYKESDAYCHEQLRMRRDVFYRLCNRLKLHGLVKRRSVKVKEQVAIFLLIVGQDARYRLGKFTFIRSSQTVSRYFHFVLRAIISMYKEVVKPARATNSPWDGDGDEDWYHYFKNAVGAIDGTHINATVPVNQQRRYRNRKAQITQNVLVACTFDMMFTYALVGWEGSAHDGRLLRDAVRPRVDRLTVPLGKYYLADAGFPHVPGFMTPFRRVKYHMSEYKKGRDPRNAMELYNYRHSSLRTVVERAIGLLKKRFAYLRKSPFFDIKTQSRIILACVALHNYLRENDPDDICDSEDDSSEEDDSLEEDEEEDEEPGEEEHIVIARSVEWTEKREAFAHTMWNEQD